MRRWIALLLFFSLLITPCALAEGVHVVGDNAGEVYCPEGSDAQTAQYVYRYQYPLLENTSETAQMINDFYDYLISDAKDFMIPMTYETLEVSPVQAYTAITSQVMCNNEDYFSVLVPTESFMGAEDVYNRQHHMHSITTQIIPFSMHFVQFYIQRSGLPALKCPLRLAQPCL